MSIYRIWRSRKPAGYTELYVGRAGELWYSLVDNILRLGDGVTPGGIPLNFGGGDEVAQQYDRLVDVDGTYTYVGEAIPGGTKGGSTWRIKRIEEIGDDVEILWANGSADFDKEWDERASYTYTA